MPAEVEIADDATRDDVDDMVKEFLKERAELTGDASDDGASETTEDTSKQTPDGDETSAVDDDAATVSGEAGSEDTATNDDDAGQTGNDWLTDEVRAGLPRWLTDEELSEFSSRDELDRALGLFARAAVNADEGRQAGDATAQQQGRARGQDGKQGDTAKTITSDPYEIDLDLSEFDEELGEKVKGALVGLRDHYEDRMKALDERFAAIEANSQANEVAAIESRFDRIVDSLGYSDLFGKTGEESQKQLEDRQRLFEHAVKFMEGPKPFGREVTLEESTQLMFNGLFHEHISKRKLKNQTRRVQEQSKMRSGVGATIPAEQLFKGPLKKHPDVQRAFKEYQNSLGED